MASAGPRRAPNRWSDIAGDPNDPSALVARADVLRAAWREPVRDRLAFLESRCRSKRVLDIGCVAHDAARMRAPGWLHSRLAAVAAECLGVDVLEDGVRTMRSMGFHAVVHDLATGLGPIEAHAPFDVIVAGELIEHVVALDMLFRTAVHTLASDGELIITTPNPYAPHRVRAAQLGIVWENADHVLYAFPSGIAELCERHGLVLAEAMVTVESSSRQRGGLVDRVQRKVRGTQWAAVGIASLGRRRIRRVDFGRVGRAVHGLWRPRRRFVGETFIYVVRRSSRPADGGAYARPS